MKYAIRPVECEGNDLILRIQISIYQCENRHISPHLQRFGATTAQQKCAKGGRTGSELPVRRTTKTTSCLRSRLHDPKRVAERTRFELVVRNDPYVGLANRWFQPLTHLSGSHLAKLRHGGGLQRYEYFLNCKAFTQKRTAVGAVLLPFAVRQITRCSRRIRRPSWRGRGARGW